MMFLHYKRYFSTLWAQRKEQKRYHTRKLGRAMDSREEEEEEEEEEEREKHPKRDENPPSREEEEERSDVDNKETNRTSVTRSRERR